MYFSSWRNLDVSNFINQFFVQINAHLSPCNSLLLLNRPWLSNLLPTAKNSTRFLDQTKFCFSQKQLSRQRLQMGYQCLREYTTIITYDIPGWNLREGNFFFVSVRNIEFIIVRTHVRLSISVSNRPESFGVANTERNRRRKSAQILVWFANWTERKGSDNRINISKAR